MTRDEVVADIQDWYDTTLRSRTGSNSTGVLGKIQEELDELKEASATLLAAAIEPNTTNAEWDRLVKAHRQEVADVGIALTVYAHLTMVDETAAQRDKMLINRSRTWVETETPGVWRHE